MRRKMNRKADRWSISTKLVILGGCVGYELFFLGVYLPIFVEYANLAGSCLLLLVLGGIFGLMWRGALHRYQRSGGEQDRPFSPRAKLNLQMYGFMAMGVFLPSLHVALTLGRGQIFLSIPFLAFGGVMGAFLFMVGRPRAARRWDRILTAKRAIPLIPLIIIMTLPSVAMFSDFGAPAQDSSIVRTYQYDSSVLAQYPAQVQQRYLSTMEDFRFDDTHLATSASGYFEAKLAEYPMINRSHPHFITIDHHKLGSYAFLVYEITNYTLEVVVSPSGFANFILRKEHLPSDEYIMMFSNDYEYWINPVIGYGGVINQSLSIVGPVFYGLAEVNFSWRLGSWTDFFLVECLMDLDGNVLVITGEAGGFGWT